MLFDELDAIIETIGGEKTSSHKEKVDTSLNRFLHDINNLLVTWFVRVDEDDKFLF